METRPTQDQQAYDLYLRALPHVYAMRPDDNTEALELLDRAISLDPGFAPALAYAAWCYEQRVVRGWPTAREGDVETGIKLARARSHAPGAAVGCRFRKLESCVSMMQPAKDRMRNNVSEPRLLGRTRTADAHQQSRVTEVKQT